MNDWPFTYDWNYEYKSFIRWETKREEKTNMNKNIKNDRGTVNPKIKLCTCICVIFYCCSTLSLWWTKIRIHTHTHHRNKKVGTKKMRAKKSKYRNPVDGFFSSWSATFHPSVTFYNSSLGFHFYSFPTEITHGWFFIRSYFFVSFRFYFFFSFFSVSPKSFFFRFFFWFRFCSDVMHKNL